MRTEITHTIIQATEFLAGRCDYAVAEDNMGFDKPDAFYGHWMPQLPESGWTDRDAQVTAGMLIKYKGQLVTAGFDYEEIKTAPTVEDRNALRIFARRARDEVRREKA